MLAKGGGGRAAACINKTEKINKFNLIGGGGYPPLRPLKFEACVANILI